MNQLKTAVLLGVGQSSVPVMSQPRTRAFSGKERAFWVCEPFFQYGLSSLITVPWSLIIIIVRLVIIIVPLVQS